ncbi:MAG: fibrillarin-like rRNA/tRNA 2'-O-methyltransferase [Patescibacteria group bacterium]|nr:fibrillarin-like rRNA/tRNA 2'-O-methyltransferase [Patescibacteria group bacterium]MDD5121321.1 fibrillarin-like rRNA/tRNA 2'-O-methyltransferase [Patescibacteria group bacterium]MDD5221806.1 fibrillarin-like rRNA/tRNA 2'-O-methyltransferase [Patescibacteria group bacterium]MDD5395760.1 fibrillarin-like rRNA/tRNA 2'-O-methyltransferase [Patescibacteria group bacterium]
MDLAEQLIQSDILKTSIIIEAFKRIKRSDFILSLNRGVADLDVPQEIGYGQTNSQPSTVAFMLELCQPKRGDRVLDIGSGSGWTTALFSEIVGPEGKIYGLERINELKEFGEQNAEKYKFVSSGRAVFMTADGSKGLPEFAPYDIIHVGAASAELPKQLFSQIRIGGRIVVPVGIDRQEIYIIERKTQTDYQTKKFPGFIFVPLIEER